MRWDEILECSPIQDASHQKGYDYCIFRIRDPQQNLHLPLLLGPFLRCYFASLVYFMVATLGRIICWRQMCIMFWCQDFAVIPLANQTLTMTTISLRLEMTDVNQTPVSTGVPDHAWYIRMHDTYDICKVNTSWQYFYHILLFSSKISIHPHCFGFNIVCISSSIGHFQRLWLLVVTCFYSGLVHEELQCSIELPEALDANEL